MTRLVADLPDDDGVVVVVEARPRVSLWLLALFTLSGTLAMHIFVPALPAAAKDLGAGNAAMQMTMSWFGARMPWLPGRMTLDRRRAPS
jgi:hypothetical protein